jgi:hypothetical protein
MFQQQIRFKMMIQKKCNNNNNNNNDCVKRKKFCAEVSVHDQETARLSASHIFFCLKVILRLSLSPSLIVDAYRAGTGDSPLVKFQVSPEKFMLVFSCNKIFNELELIQ